MDNARNAHIEEMNRIANAMCWTKSPYLKRDYGKALRRMEKELKEYDRYMSEFGNKKKNSGVNNG